MFRFTMAVCVALACCQSVSAQQRFVDLVGPVPVSDVKAGAVLDVPYITWGGDVATFLSNGGLTTAQGSTYQQLGLNLRLVKGDDFVQQVRDYVSGKSPFLRGTLDQLGQASEVIGSDPRTKPVIVVQLTWSAGDHIVAREGINKINDLIRQGKLVRIACQQGGPHVGFIYKILLAAQGKKEQVEIVWVQDLTGPKGPAEAFRNDPTIDAACVITPDMLGLTGGQDQKGTGAEGTIKGAHVVVSTQQMNRAIADVIAVRSDYFKANQPTVEKYVAGYLKGCEQLVALRKQFGETNKLSPEYKSILTVAQTAFGRDVIPTLEIDGHGLLLDATFVGLPGQISFFEDKGNLSGYEPSAKGAIDLAVDWGYASNRAGFAAAGFDYQKIATLAGIKYEAPVGVAKRIDAEAVGIFPNQNLDDRTLLQFTINFDPNQQEFTTDQYGAEFNRAIKNASSFGNAVIVIRGHSDPTKTLVDLIKAGMAKNLIRRDGAAGNYKYYFNGQELNLSQTDLICKLITAGSFDGVNPSPKETMQAALNLSLSRAEAVKKAVSDFAIAQKVNLDVSQIQPVGAGITEPLIAKPKNIEEAKQNMRVEFRIVRVPAEAIKQSDFDF